MKNNQQWRPCSLNNHHDLIHRGHICQETPSSQSQKAEQTKRAIANRLLWQAITMNNPNQLQNALQHGANPEGIDGSKQHTPLTAASGYGFNEIVKILLKNGANPNQLNPLGFTPLATAVQLGHVDVMDTLLQHGANPNQRGALDMDALQWAIPPAGKLSNEQRKNVINTLIRNGADPNTEDYSGLTVLMMMARSDYPNTLACLEILLQNGAQPNYRSNTTGGTALLYATFTQQPDKVKKLLDYGADPNLSDLTKTTPLMIATNNNDAEIVQILLSRGSDPNARNRMGETALVMAVLQGNKTITQILLDWGAYLTPEDHQMIEKKVEQDFENRIG